MRVRIPDQPPTREQIEKLLKSGSSPNDQSPVVERLRQSCYLDSQNRRLSAKQRLIEQYRQDGLVLFLGAGVSKESFIPTWTELIRRLVVEAKIDATYEEVNRAFPSLLSQFDLVGHHLKSPQKFARMLYRCFYQNLPFKKLLEEIPDYEKGEAKWHKWKEVITALQRNGTLKAVGELVIVGDGEKLKRNPQIHAVLTTNADNLLEIYCRARCSGQARLLTMVDRASVGDHPNAISVYHLHGALDVRGENFVGTGHPCTKIPPKKKAENRQFIVAQSCF